ncbi:hypothetical protein QBC38DRAFT_201157 [Podospora fimiseda]|uniref:CHAT domain-containing protein n=1 Tax=Podospora fimiseda TaxID=252190 RepID=A0AAN7H1V1_9PEZI|nr:hypothetical protein QBC38DRAFT_201157 [Podospora fimiseda]
MLAYLSACNTAMNASSRLADDSIHLAAACRIAGFRNVIGTLWPVSDYFCVGLAKTVYQGVLEGGESWARILHLAIKKERDSICIGDDNAEEAQNDSDRAIVGTRDGVPAMLPRKAAERPGALGGVHPHGGRGRRRRRNWDGVMAWLGFGY